AGVAGQHRRARPVSTPRPGGLGVGAFRVHGWHHVDLWSAGLAGAKHHTAGVWSDHTAFRLASDGDTGSIAPARGRGMILLGLLLVLLAILGTPLFAVFGALAWCLFRAAGIDTSAIMIELYRLASAPTLLPIPLFTFAGYVLAASQAPQRLVRCMQALVGWLPGGLALMALCACAFFTAFTGASGVTIIALGGFLLPVLLKEHYPALFSLGLLTTGGSLGLLFPPSLPIILYGLVAHTPVDLLFLAGVVPGLVLLLLAVYSVYQAYRHGVPRRRSAWTEVWEALWEAKWELVLPLLVLVGIYGGLVTVNEAALVTAAYSLVVTVGIHRDLRLWRD